MLSIGKRHRCFDGFNSLGGFGRPFFLRRMIGGGAGGGALNPVVSPVTARAPSLAQYWVVAQEPRERPTPEIRVVKYSANTVSASYKLARVH